jgi:chemotaxis protein MotB
METIIITKKVKSRHGGHHGGAWKVAFADFVTAMMALFIVLWVLGQSQQVKQNIAQHFRNPGVFESTTGTILPEETKLVPNASEQEKIDVADSIASLHGAQQWQPQELLLGHLEKRLQSLLVTMPELARLKNQVEISATPEGLRIDLLEKDSSSFFDTGSTQLTPPAVALLRTIAKELRTLPNPIILEGHTDSHPYTATSAYSNWELSTDRANSARRILEKYGVAPDRIEQVRGYADKKLRYLENPYDIRNRRVSICIAYDR